jgi:hypothetical protein
MQQITAAGFQQWVRIALYIAFTSLANYGVVVPDNTRTLVAGVAGILGTLIWTAYGTRLNALIAAVAASPDVAKVVVSDPAKAGAIANDKVVVGNGP